MLIILPTVHVCIAQERNYKERLHASDTQVFFDVLEE